MTIQYKAGSATAGDDVAEISAGFLFRRVHINNSGANGMQVRVDGGDWIVLESGETLDVPLYGQAIEHQDTVAASTTDFRYILSE